MTKEKQIEKVSKSRQEYLKFKPFADDLRNAESWCELDGVLNRYQTVKNLSKMGYRKQSEVAREIFEEIERFLYMHFRFCKEEIGNDDTEYVKGRLELNTQIQNLIAELKKKYKESEKDK
jgi:hypothetical protein